MVFKSIIGATCTCLAVVSFNANAAVLPLEGRLEMGAGSGVFLAYYDPNLNITWAADANINGLDWWDGQLAWVSALTIGGVSGWRLPFADKNLDETIVDCFGGGVTGCEDNEMGFLYWEEGITAVAPSPFSDIQAANYFDRIGNVVGVFVFNFGDGVQGIIPAPGDSDFAFAWAVHDGDVPAVIPLPAAVWLLGSGLIGLIGFARRKKA